MKIALIGGSGLYDFEGIDVLSTDMPDTPFGKPSDAIVTGTYHQHQLMFLARHGKQHQIPPHQVNYRANIRALKDLGAEQIIAVNAVGGIADNLQPGDIVIPDQIIDYTYGREHTFYDDFSAGVEHIDFTYPFDQSLRAELLSAKEHHEHIRIHSTGVYGCTQGPRLETLAEILRMKNDGCTLVGMTAMPEAALARECDLPYISICTVANMAAGLTDELITMDDVFKVLETGLQNTKELIKHYLNTH